MKRQSTISSFFTKKVVEKKPRLDNSATNDDAATAPMDIDPTPKKKLSSTELTGLHQQFQQKFGSLYQERDQKRQHVESLMNNDSMPPLQKYTPLESQVVELKSKYPTCLLLIQVGYKFRFFGEDAKIASQVLHVAHFMDRNFYVASIPVHRLNYHVQKLVNAGYKVGIVRQTETAALKAAGSNRGAPFERELTQMITKGTIMEDESYLMCLVEEKRGGHGPDDRMYTGMVAIQTSTGDIIYDTFEDTYMRNELETRLLHIEPTEILIPSRNLSKPTEKLIQHVSLFYDDTVRIERMPKDDTFCQDYNNALTFVSDFYANALLPMIVELPDIIIKTLACLIRYLKEFKLSSMLKITGLFKHFISSSHMLLNSDTMMHLEIYRNSTNFKQQGSLFSILDHTRTKFGQRLLRKWVARPLVDINKLNERMDAIEELIKTDIPKKNRVMLLLKQLPDLEKGLTRIHYGKSSPTELIQVLDALFKISRSCNEPKFQSPLLNRLFDTLPTIHHDIIEFQSCIHHSTDNKLDFFNSEEARCPEIPRQKKNIKYIESLLQDHIIELKKQMPDLKYVTVAGIEYLFEVVNTRKVPHDWIKINNTKVVSRYHCPFIIQQLKEKERHYELLVLAAERAYNDFLVEISEKYETFRNVVSCLAHLDCLLSLTMTANQPNYTKPTLTATTTEIQVVGGRHPILEHLCGTCISNDIQFTSCQKAMILTGPNMGGKSSYSRQIALICIMAHMGSYVPATSARIGLLDAVYTRMGASDNMMRGKSTFMVELQETADIMRQATSKSLVILDELGRGTSTHDGQAIAYAVLEHFVKEIKSITLFVTHYPSLGKLQTVFPRQVRTCYMSYFEQDGVDGISNIVFLYKLVDGIAMNSYGMNVARLADIPVSVVKKAKQKSDEMQQHVGAIQVQNRNLRILRNLMQNNPIDPYDLVSLSHP